MGSELSHATGILNCTGGKQMVSVSVKQRLG